MASPPLLHLQDIHLTLGAAPLLSGATLAVGRGERVALVGRNGSGKSTLLRIASGTVQPDRGTCFVQPGARLAVLAQEPDLAGFASVQAYVEAGLPEDEAYLAAPALEALGLSGGLDPASLSGGETRRAALARALAGEPDILLLDEPTNHLDLPAIEALEETLLGFRGALVVISHDRRFLERVSRTMVWLDRGTTRRLEQGFAGFEAWRDQVLEEEETQAHKLTRQIAREEHWLRYGVTARRKRNVRRLAELGTLRKQRRERVAALGSAKAETVEADGSGSLVILADGISKTWGDRVVVRDFTTRILRGDRIGIVGPNGAGKTTLLSMLTGALAPDSGRVALGTQLAVGRLDQRRDVLDPDATLAETLTGGQGDVVVVGGQSKHVIGYMKDFLFAPEQSRTPIRMLSGGERARAALARMMAQPTNLLILDEPTNDLDLETLDLLQEQIAEYRGTVLLVSHDRDVLDRVATATIAWEGEGVWREYPGGYSDLVALRGHGVAARVAEAAPVTAKPAVARAAEPASPRSRLSFKEKHALETLPERIAQLEAEIARAQKTLADPTLFGRDRAGFERTSAALAKAEAARAEAEEQWLTLELKREELEGR